MTKEYTTEEFEKVKKEVQDETKFKTEVLITIRTLATDFKEHIKSSTTFRNDVTKLKTHRTLQWWFIGGIILSILSLPIWLIK